jgi:hypothetical protein
MGKLIISENEKNEIRGLYGVLSEQTSTTTYKLGDHTTTPNFTFNVISAKEIPGGKQMVINLDKIAMQGGKMLNGWSWDFNNRLGLTGVLTSENGKVSLKINPISDDILTKNFPPNTDRPDERPVTFETLKDAIEFNLPTNLVNGTMSVDELNDKTLVTRLKNIKPIQGSK